MSGLMVYEEGGLSDFKNYLFIGQIFVCLH